MDSTYYSRILPRIHSSSERNRENEIVRLFTESTCLAQWYTTSYTHRVLIYGCGNCGTKYLELHVDRTRSPDVILKCRRNHRSPHG